ncbi:MAG: histidine kinase [Candidatus Eisenbacteria bacterium]
MHSVTGTASPAARSAPLLGTRLAWIIVIGAPLLLGLLETGQAVARAAYEGLAVNWAQTLRMTLPRWLLFIPLAILVERICRHLPLESRGWRRALPLHAAAGVVFALLHLAACVVVYGFLIEGVPNRFSFRLEHLLKVYLAMDLLIYWATVGGWTALHHARLARERELTASRLRADLADARIEALRGQLDPHFLFNALNAIAVTALKGKPEVVAQMLEGLGELLRISFHRDLPGELVLARELELARRYLDLQELRFGDRLEVRQEIEPAALEALIPAMLLQPLLENAIEHGLAGRSGPGVVTLRAMRRDASLLLSIEDDGPGWPEGGRPTRLGVGLGNTRSRLEHLYGGAHRFELFTPTGGGAVVRIELPFRTREDGAVRSEIALRREATR